MQLTKGFLLVLTVVCSATALAGNGSVGSAVSTNSSVVRRAQELERQIARDRKQSVTGAHSMNCVLSVSPYGNDPQSVVLDLNESLDHSDYNPYSSIVQTGSIKQGGRIYFWEIWNDGSGVVTSGTAAYSCSVSQ